MNAFSNMKYLIFKNVTPVLVIFLQSYMKIDLVLGIQVIFKRVIKTSYQDDGLTS